MKTLIYTVYVAAVLLFSAFARAEMAMPFSTFLPTLAPVAINEVAIAQETLDLKIDGHLPNSCYSEPSAVLVQDPENPNVLSLRLSSPVPTAICHARIQEYSKIVNLPVLAQNSQIVFANDAEYLVKIEGFDFELLVPGSALNKVPGFIAF